VWRRTGGKIQKIIIVKTGRPSEQEIPRAGQHGAGLIADKRAKLFAVFAYGVK